MILIALAWLNITQLLSIQCQQAKFKFRLALFSSYEQALALCPLGFSFIQPLVLWTHITCVQPSILWKSVICPDGDDGWTNSMVSFLIRVQPMASELDLDRIFIVAPRIPPTSFRITEPQTYKSVSTRPTLFWYVIIHTTTAKSSRYLIQVLQIMESPVSFDKHSFY